MFDPRKIRNEKRDGAGAVRPCAPASGPSPKDVALRGTLAADQLVYTEGGPRRAGDLAEAGSFVALAYDADAGRTVARRAWVVSARERPVVEVVTDKGAFLISADARVGTKVDGTAGARVPAGYDQAYLAEG